MNTEYQIRRRNECAISDINLSTGAVQDDVKIKRLVTPNSDIIDIIKKYYKNFEKIKAGEINKRLKEWEGREFELLDSLKEKYKDQLAEKPELIDSIARKKDVVDDVTKVKNIVHILGFEKFPIPQYRWGFLPISVEIFLDTDSSVDVTKKNTAVLKTNATPILRYGVEQSRHQSFLGCISDVYTYYHPDFLPTIENIRNKIAEKLTIDVFLKSNNGSLVSVFQRLLSKIEAISDAHTENYRDSEFYKSITNLENPAQNRFLKDTIQAFENFLAYLRDPDSFIDHTYLWDIISMKESVLFDGGINMIIMEVVDHDVTDNVEFICPTNSYSDDIYNPKKGTILLLKRGEFFEPIYRYGKTNFDHTTTSSKAVKIFQKNTTPFSLKRVFEMIQRTTKNQCKPQQSIKKYINNGVKVYEFKQNLPASTINTILKSNGFIVRRQIMNYRGKIIGLMVSNNSVDPDMVYVPTLPSSVIKDVETKYIDDVTWMPYEASIKRLTTIQGNTDGKVFCKPKLRVVEDGVIVGILTETNQFIQMAEPFEANDEKYGDEFIETVGYKNTETDGYFKTDKKLATNDKKDDIRLKTIRNISFETQFYLGFRIKIRSILNEYINKDIRKQIIELIDSIQYSYHYKLKKLIDILFKLTQKSFSFVEIKENVLSDFNNLSLGSNYSDIQYLCLTKKNTVCIPKINLVDPTKNNSVFYFTKIADELLRYSRIRSFILEPKRYLNITNTDYSVRKDEILLLHSVLFGTFFDDLIPFEMNQYIQNIDYNNANPALSTERFKNKVDLKEQIVLDKNTSNIADFVQCIETVSLVLETLEGKNWRVIFPEGTKELSIQGSEICSFYPILYVIKNHLNQ
jgi:competence protein ComGC